MREGLGTLKNFQAKIHIDPAAPPRFCNARTVPYAIRVKVGGELECLVLAGILKPVQLADWAAIVPVLKQDHSSVHICGDFHQTVNPIAKLDRYPIPKVEDLSPLARLTSAMHSSSCRWMRHQNSML